MKRVTIITNIPAPYRLDLFNYLQKNSTDYEFFVMYTSVNEDNRQWTIDYEKIKNSIFLKSKVIKINKRFDSKYIHIPQNVWKELSNLNPDIIIAFEYNIAALQALRWSKKNRKFFIHLTDGTLNSEKAINILQKINRKHIINNSDVFIASSTMSKEKLIYYGAKEEKIFVSLLTVDINKYLFQKKSNQGLNLLYVGGLIKRKGVDLLLEGLIKVRHPFHLTVVGNGIEYNNLKKMVIHMNMEDKVSFEGFLEAEDLRKKYQESNIFILPTREDCYGLVLLEAMCASLPVICSKFADGSKDLVKNGVNGYILDPYNSQKFAETIDKLLSDINLLSDMGKKSYEIAKTFSFENVSKEFYKALKQNTNPSTVQAKIE